MKFKYIKYFFTWLAILYKPAFAQQINPNAAENNLLYYYNSQLGKIEEEIAVEEAEYNATFNQALLASLNKKKAKRELLNIYGSKVAKRTTANLANLTFFSKMEAFLNKQKELEQKYDLKINFSADEETLEELKSLGITLGKTISKNEAHAQNRIINVVIHYFKSTFSIEYKAILSAPLALEIASTEEIEKSFSFATSDNNSKLFTTNFTYYLETKIQSLNLTLNPSNIAELEKLKNEDNTFTFITSAGVPYTLPAANLKSIKFYFNDKFTIAKDGIKFVADGALQGFTYEGEPSYIACYSKHPPYNFSGYYKDVSNSLNCTGEKRIDSLSKKCSQKDCVIVATTCIENGVLKFDIKKIPLTNNVWPGNNNSGSGLYLATLPVNYNTTGKTAEIKDFLFSTSYSPDAKRFIDSLNICDREYIPHAITVANIIHNYPIVVSQCYGLDRLINDFNVRRHLLSVANNVNPSNGTGLEQYEQKVIDLMNRAKELKDGAYNSVFSDKICSKLITFSDVKNFVNNSENYCTLNFVSNLERIRLLKVLLSESGIGGHEAIVNLFKTINLEISDANTIAFFNALTDPIYNPKVGSSLITEIIKEISLGSYTDLIKTITAKLTSKDGIIANYFPKNDQAEFSSLYYYDESYLFTDAPIGTHRYDVELLPDGDVLIEKEFIDEYIERTTVVQGEPITHRIPHWQVSAPITVKPFTLLTFILRSSVSSISEASNGNQVITAPAIFLKFTEDKTFNNDLLRVGAIVADAVTVATGPGLILKAYRAGRMALALYEGAQVVASVANLAANGLSPDSDLKKWIDEFNMVIVVWGGAKALGKVYDFNYLSFAKNNPFKGLSQQSVQNLIDKYSSIKASLKNHINNVNISKQVDEIIEYLRAMLKIETNIQKTRGVSKSDFISSVTDLSSKPHFIEEAWDLWKNEQWSQLEQFFRLNNINFDPSISNVWPPMQGFKSITHKLTGEELNNKIFDRFQKQNSLGGSYASPVSNNSVYSLQSRALGVNYDDLTDLGQDYYYFKFRINKPPGNLEFSYGEAAPWFNEIGGATQIKSSTGFHNLADKIDIIEKWHYKDGTWKQIIE